MVYHDKGHNVKTQNIGFRYGAKCVPYNLFGIIANALDGIWKDIYKHHYDHPKKCCM